MRQARQLDEQCGAAAHRPARRLQQRVSLAATARLASRARAVIAVSTVSTVSAAAAAKAEDGCKVDHEGLDCPEEDAGADGGRGIAAEREHELKLARLGRGQSEVEPVSLRRHRVDRPELTRHEEGWRQRGERGRQPQPRAVHEHRRATRGGATRGHHGADAPVVVGEEGSHAELQAIEADLQLARADADGGQRAQLELVVAAREGRDAHAAHARGAAPGGRQDADGAAPRLAGGHPAEADVLVVDERRRARVGREEQHAALHP